MFNSPLPILCVSGFARTVAMPDSKVRDLNGDELDIDALFFETFQNKVRRASRYVRFSNLAALQCLNQIDRNRLEGKRIGLFLGTGLGNTPDAIKFTEEILQHHQTVVSPSTFINTVSNAGLFYAARALGVECITNVISQETVSFEAALLTAAFKIEYDEIDFALVGGSDVIEAPYDAAAERIYSKEVEPKTLGEGAAFLLMAKKSFAETKPLGYLEDVTLGISQEKVFHESHQPGLLLGYGVDQKEISSDTTYAYRAISGDFSTGSAFGLCAFLKDKRAHGSRLHHLNHHQDGAYGGFKLTRLG